MSASQGPRRLINRQGIAELAGVSPAAVTNWIRRYDGSFPSAIDSEFFDADEVQQWLELTKRIAPQEVTASRLAFELVAPLRMDLTIQMAAAYAMTMVTIAASSGTAATITDPLEVARSLEAVGKFKPPSLTGPLSSMPIQGDLATATLYAAREAITRGAEHGVTPKDVFEALLAWADEQGGRWGSENTTPPEVNSLIAQLIPRDASTVYDPVCGLGGTLLAAAASLEDAVQLTGGEIDPTTWALCVQRMALHKRTASIRREDATEVLGRSGETYDAIVANPPQLRAPDVQSDPLLRLAERRLMNPKVRVDWAWALALLDHLTPDGLALVTVPTGALSSNARGDREVRFELVRSGSLRGVFLLPQGLLGWGKSRSALLILGQPRTAPQSVLMTQVEQGDLAASTELHADIHKWHRSPDNFPGRSGKSRAVPVLELVAGPVNLNPMLWIEEMSGEEVSHHLTEQWARLQASLATLPTELSAEPTLSSGQIHRMTSLAELEDQRLIEVVRTRPLRPDTTPGDVVSIVTNIDSNGDLVWQEAAETRHPTVTTRPGDVILKTAGRINAAVDHEGNTPVAGHLWLVRPLTDDSRVDPDLLAHLLSSPRVRTIAEASSTTMPRLRNPGDVTIPLLSNEDASRLLTYLREVTSARQAGRALVDAASAAAQSLVEAAEAGMVIAPSDKPGKEAK